MGILPLYNGSQLRKQENILLGRQRRTKEALPEERRI
jgi:hypothetical protein